MIIAALVAGALAAPASDGSAEAAALARMAPAFQGTIVNVYADGRRGRLLLNADRTYRYVGRGGARSGGVWRFDGGFSRLCLSQRQPIPVPLRYCTSIPSQTIWTAKAQGGEPITVHVESGRGG